MPDVRGLRNRHAYLLAPLLRGVTLATGIAILAAWSGIAHADDVEGDADLPPAMAQQLAPWFGDLPAMRERRLVRVLVTHDKTNFFFRDGRAYGFEYDMLRRFEKELNAGIEPREVPTEFVFLPVPVGDVLSGLVEGRGDIAAAGLTITPERSRDVAFTAPYLTGVSEIFVTSPGIDPKSSLADVAMHTIVVPKGTSYVRNLKALGERLGRPIDVVEAEEGLQSEDILEMVAAGAIDATVVDEHIALIWSSVYPELVLRRDLPVHAGSEIAWAVRKDSPRLAEALSRFADKHRKGTLVGNLLFSRYYEKGVGLTNLVTEGAIGRLQTLEPTFRKYADRYGFDWLAVAAQAYAESGLRHDRRGPAGAVGVMQILPSTAAGKVVAIPDIETPDANIHAGVKYMAYLRGRFAKFGIEPSECFDFALAAYNAGPGMVFKFRKRARELGLDANRWFGNVELAAIDLDYTATVRYVAKVNKYYVAYRVARESQRIRDVAREAVGG